MKKKMDSVQALRALAFFFIFLKHCYVNISDLPVSVFFTVSGFLLVNSRYPKPDDFTPSVVKNVRSAYLKIKNLYLLYILTMLPIMALDVLAIYKGVSADTYKTVFIEFILSALLLQSWSVRYCMAFNGVAWYLSAAVFLYFCFPYILRLLRKYRRISTAVLVMAGLTVLEFLLSSAEPAVYSLFSALGGKASDADFVLWFTYIFPPFRLMDFALGCNLGWLFLMLREKEHSKALVWGLDLLIAVLAAVTGFFYRGSEYFLSQEQYRHTFLYVLPALAAVYSFALAKGPLSRLLTNKVTVFVGNLSSYTYLIHQDVIRFLMLALTSLGMSFEGFRLTVIPLGLALTLGLSLAYRKLAERRGKPKAE